MKLQHKNIGKEIKIGKVPKTGSSQRWKSLYSLLLLLFLSFSQDSFIQGTFSLLTSIKVLVTTQLEIKKVEKTTGNIEDNDRVKIAKAAFQYVSGKKQQWEKSPSRWQLS